MRKAYPYADLLLETFKDGSTRPVSPAYNDISLAVQRTIHPPSGIDPQSDIGALREPRRRRHPLAGAPVTDGSTDTPPARRAPAAEPDGPARPPRAPRRHQRPATRPSAASACCCRARRRSSCSRSPRTRSGTRSSSRCTAPTSASRTRPSSSASTTTRRCCSSSLWWQDLRTTAAHHRHLGRRSSSCSACALAVVMHRAIVGRGLVRSSILIPYGIDHRRRRAGVEVRVHAGHRLRRLAGSAPTGRGSPSADRRSSSSSAPRSGRRRRSWPCCCSPASRSCPTESHRGGEGRRRHRAGRRSARSRCR